MYTVPDSKRDGTTSDTKAWPAGKPGRFFVMFCHVAPLSFDTLTVPSSVPV